MRAAELVLDATGHRFGVHLTLTKRIPVRAGLGGGSSDAAAALHRRTTWRADAVPRHELLQFAARLGSDVPFFFSGAPLALAWGRGERLLRLPPLPPRPHCWSRRRFRSPPPRHTAGSMRRGSQSARRGALALDLDALSRWGDVGRMAGNDFESPVFSRHGTIRAAFEALVGDPTAGLPDERLGIDPLRHLSVRPGPRGRGLMLGRKHGLVSRVETAGQPAPV